MSRVSGSGDSWTRWPDIPSPFERSSDPNVMRRRHVVSGSSRERARRERVSTPSSVMMTTASHLAYQLELPEERGDVQRDLEIKPKASYVVVVKNPEAATPPGAGLPERQKAELPGRMQEQFRGRKFMQAEPQLLDHEGAEVILIGADEDVPGELGIELHPEHQTLETTAMFRDLSLPRSQVGRADDACRPVEDPIVRAREPPRAGRGAASRGA